MLNKQANNLSEKMHTYWCKEQNENLWGENQRRMDEALREASSAEMG
jgi:predicted RNA-binding protein with PUA domain